jgi:RNase P subunit RPR2
MKKGADIKIGGKSLTEAIEKIEERLGILHPNSELEERWDKLKDLRRQYVEMEKDILEKEKIMKILKEA